MYQIEGKYLAMSHDLKYASIPDQASVTLCLASDKAHCSLNTALYPVENMNWCVLALFLNNTEAIQNNCKLEVQEQKVNLAYNVKDTMWAISSVEQERMRVVCLDRTHTVTIKPPFQLLTLGQGCQGCLLYTSPSPRDA